MGGNIGTDKNKDEKYVIRLLQVKNKVVTLHRIYEKGVQMMAG